jgi:prevent-host-death family protein
VREATSILPELIERARAGEAVLITRNGKPVARLVPVAETKGLASVRVIWRGRVRIADDFDELPDDIADAFDAC